MPEAKNVVHLGENVVFKKEGNIGWFGVDLSQRLRPSKSGKNRVVGTTGGNISVPGTDIKIGINAYTK